ncbi:MULTISPECIES: ATP-binding protein [unclassified Nocardiopsis]|uniref:ATP-binding protein n=1 Tax=unclassified Nocardiopsis TaxID=2649073 RepID=UPI0013577357|nr:MULTISPECIES: ATP-binding protein [unclassified Nocardiopsis]
MEASEGAPTLFGEPVNLIRFPTPEQCVCSVELLERCLPARLARRTAHSFLGAFDVLPDQALQIEEAVAELVTNSERYSHKPWRLRVYLDDHALWVGVFDGDVHTIGLLRGLLARKDGPDLMREDGRGLFLVRVACDGQCWVRTVRTGSVEGKEVLMRFSVPNAGDTAGSAA